MPEDKNSLIAMYLMGTEAEEPGYPTPRGF